MDVSLSRRQVVVGLPDAPRGFAAARPGGHRGPPGAPQRGDSGEAFTGTPGKYVPLAETVRSVKEILDGKHDAKEEQAFYMKGTIDEVA
jgi:hypothetical protein